MLRVTSILEGGLNLETGKEIPRSMLVTNGVKSVTVPVSDSVVAELVALFAEEMESNLGVRSSSTESAAALSVPRNKALPKAKPEVRELFEPEDTRNGVTGELEFAPGEEYPDDAGTGVASL